MTTSLSNNTMVTDRDLSACAQPGLRYDAVLAEASLQAASASARLAIQASNTIQSDTQRFLLTISRDQRIVHGQLVALMSSGCATASDTGGEESAVQAGFFHPAEKKMHVPLEEVYSAVYGDAIRKADSYDLLRCREQDPEIRSLYDTLSALARGFVFSCRIAYLEALADGLYGTEASEESAPAHV